MNITKEIRKKLVNIDRHLTWDGVSHGITYCTKYDCHVIFANGHFCNNFYDLSKSKQLAIVDVLKHAAYLPYDFNPYSQQNPVTPADPEQFKPTDNPYQKYTDHLATVLQAKNTAYGNSFAKSLDEDGLLVAKIRIGDKFNRLSHLIKHGELKENDESLADTLEDLAGYAILTWKYIKENTK